ALIHSSKRPSARAQALATLACLGECDAKTVQAALGDAHPGVRRQAILAAEPLLADSPKLGEALRKLASDDDPQVQLQCAYTLGEWKDERDGNGLAQIAL